MLDLNHILLFIACVSSLVMLAQTLRRGGVFRAWRLASLAVLLVTGGAWLVNPDTAGFVGGGAWLALLMVPASGIRKVAELATHQRYARARQWAVPLRFLHPSGALRAQAELLRALELAQAGKFFRGARPPRSVAEQPHERRPAGDRAIISSPRRVDESCRLGAE